MSGGKRERPTVQSHPNYSPFAGNYSEETSLGVHVSPNISPGLRYEQPDASYPDAFSASSKSYSHLRGEDPDAGFTALQDQAQSTTHHFGLDSFIKDPHTVPWTGVPGPQHGKWTQNLQLSRPGPMTEPAYGVTGPFDTMDPSGHSEAADSGPEPDEDRRKKYPAPPRSHPPHRHGTHGYLDNMSHAPYPPISPSRWRCAPPACRACGKQPKNVSDAKKHELTHTKPHKCPHSDCLRSKEGFATVNDLERHRKSVHLQHPNVGQAGGYICRACDHPGNNENRKFWPRRDNFKAHIRRKHSKADENKLLESSKVDSRPEDARTVLSDTLNPSQAGETVHDYQNVYGSSEEMSHQTHPGEELSHFYSPKAATEEFSFMHGATEQYAHREQAYASAPTSTTPLHLSHRTSIQQDQQILPTRQQRPSTVSQGHTSYDEQRHGSEQASKPLAWMTPASNGVDGISSSQQLAMIDPSPPMAAPEGRFPCSKCSKVKRRDCDLKKHMKRHTRPYGCTFPDCTKKFGSRNDWKRHECSQHVLIEMWKCACPRDGGGVCNSSPFHSVEMLNRHLESAHQVKDVSERSRLCKEYRLGENGNGRFWCGFCQKLIDLPKGMFQSAWERRFKHIGDHIDKEGRDIGDWVCMDYSKPKRIITEADRKLKRRLEQLGVYDEEEEGLPPNDLDLPGSAATANAFPFDVQDPQSSRSSAFDFALTGDGADDLRPNHRGKRKYDELGNDLEPLVPSAYGTIGDETTDTIYAE